MEKLIHSVENEVCLMRFAKRIFLFLAVNFLVILAISVILSFLPIQPFLSANGLNLNSLLIFCLIWGMVGALISLSLSRVLAKWMTGLQIINPATANEFETKLYQMVERLARDAGLPSTPQVGIFSSPQMNAFATGPTKRKSLVAVSTALMQNMNEGELEAVLGHEISHIANGDMVTMTLLQGVVNAFVMFLARVLAYAVSSLGKERNRSRSYGSFYLLTFLFEIIFMILGSMVIATFSRFREFRADQGGAMLARKENMIAALEKLGGQKSTAHKDRTNSLSALMISRPSRYGFLRVFATHPPIEERIARLKLLP